MYAGTYGSFASGGTVVSWGIARWAGDRWEGVGDVYGNVLALEVYDRGTGPALFVGGDFWYVGGVYTPPVYSGGLTSPALACYDGTRWSAVETGWPIGMHVTALTSYDDGSGPALVVAGGFQATGGVVSESIVKWDGQDWSGFGMGIPNASIRDMLVWDHGGGRSLYVGGYFDYAGTALAPRVARWDGTDWHGLGLGLYSNKGNGVVHDMEVYDDGTGEALYVCGTFQGALGVPGTSRLARWSGSEWSAVAPLGGPSPGAVNVIALRTFDDGVRGPGLFVGGAFWTVGGLSATGLARYDGSWSSLGSIPSNGTVIDMMRFDDGPTPTLWVSGWFPIGGGQQTGLGRYQYVCEPCYPDCDGSGSLGLDDFLCFRARFAQGDPQADCDASGTLNVNDYICFQTKFALGC